jgi:hypothetical protein
MRSEPPRGCAMRSELPGGRGESHRGGSGPLGCASGASLRGVRGVAPPGRYCGPSAKAHEVGRAWSDAGWLRGQTTRRRIHRRSDGGPERRQVLRRGTRAPLCMLHRNPPLCVKTGLEADLATHMRLGGRSALSRLLFRVCFLAKRAGWLRPGRRRLRGRPPSRPSGCVRGDVAGWQPWFVGPKTSGASGLTAAVGDHYGEIGDGDSTDCRNRRPPAGARHEQGNRGRKTSDPDTHHDQVAALP